MELLYLIILLIYSLIKDVENVLLKKENINKFKDEKILHVSEEPSLLQCAQRCKFIDKNSIVDFKNWKCTCVKYEVDEEQGQQGTLSEVFMNQRIMNEIETPKVAMVNVALNKNARQSTTYNLNFNATNAIDGLLGTRSFTQKLDNQWWSVDLNNAYEIMYMIIPKANTASRFNRALVAETRKEENLAWVTCKNIGDLTKDFLNSTFTCDNPTNARYVRIRSSVLCHIHFNEFEVYARVPVQDIKLDSNKN